MPWPFTSASSSNSNNDNDTDNEPPTPTRKRPISWSNSLNATDWSHYTSPQTLIHSALLTTATLVLLRLYRLHLRRIPTAPRIPSSFLRRRSLYGYVTSVGDGDNFRIFHTPGGRLAGWGWMPGRRIADLTRQRLKDNTIHVRVAGVDAPELAHFGKPAQPYGAEALAFLRGYLVRRYVRVYIYRKDQYERVVASVYVRSWWGWRTDVGLEMLRRGWATVYEAKFGSEFGDKEEVYRKAEDKAKRGGVGMWKDAKEPGYFGKILGLKKGELESPREFKNRMKASEKDDAGHQKVAGHQKMKR